MTVDPDVLKRGEHQHRSNVEPTPSGHLKRVEHTDMLVESRAECMHHNMHMHMYRRQQTQAEHVVSLRKSLSVAVRSSTSSAAHARAEQKRQRVRVAEWRRAQRDHGKVRAQEEAEWRRQGYPERAAQERSVQAEYGAAAAAIVGAWRRADLRRPRQSMAVGGCQRPSVATLEGEARCRERALAVRPGCAGQVAYGVRRSICTASARTGMPTTAAGVLNRMLTAEAAVDDGSAAPAAVGAEELAMQASLDDGIMPAAAAPVPAATMAAAPVPAEAAPMPAATMAAAPMPAAAAPLPAATMAAAPMPAAAAPMPAATMVAAPMPAAAAPLPAAAAPSANHDPALQAAPPTCEERRYMQQAVAVATIQECVRNWLDRVDASYCPEGSMLAAAARDSGGREGR